MCDIFYAVQWGFNTGPLNTGEGLSDFITGYGE